jgi:hypothetical protein
MSVPTFSTAELDAFWARYVSMNAADVAYVCSVEPVFAQMLWVCESQGFYGFADYQNSCAFGAGSDPKKYIGGRATHWIGPTKS